MKISKRGAHPTTGHARGCLTWWMYFKYFIFKGISVETKPSQAPPPPFLNEMILYP